jgi:ABC-2 type transport system ATP-binding protein
MVARLFGLDRATARANTALVLGQMGLEEAADRLVRTYSGGMRRKLDLGASLVGAPRLLLLDEPTTGLDPRSRIDLWDAIRDLVERGTDVLLTTQYLDEADHLASNIVIIDHGKAIASGTPSELKRRAGQNVIEAHVRTAGDMPTVAEAFRRLSGGEPALDEATRRVSVGVEGEGDHVATWARMLEDLSGSIDDIALRPPKLDEVFLALTGQALEEEPADGGRRRGRAKAAAGASG